VVRHSRRLCACFLAPQLLLLFLFPPVYTGEPLSTLSLPIATVSGTLNPREAKGFSFIVPTDLYDSLLHVVVNATAPDLDRLDLTIDDNLRADIQDDWWDILGSLIAGEHALNATTSLDAANQLTFVVEIYEIPTPPFTIAGTFPQYNITYNNLVYLEFNVTTPGDYLVSAAASAGNFAIYVEGYDPVDVSGIVEWTVQFTEAQTYMVVVEDDILGTGDATMWSMMIRPAAATTTSSTTSTSTETTSATSSTMTSATSTGTSSSVSSTVTTTTTESSTSTSSEQTTTPNAPPRCVIATAAYGSEMAPEVVYMRFVRDELIGSTPTGKILVAGFNAFYYSWSPSLARGIAASQVLRAVFRVLLLPLVGIVHVTTLAFTTLAGMTGIADLASVLAFLLAALVTMTVYIALPALAWAKLYQKARRSRCVTESRLK